MPAQKKFSTRCVHVGHVADDMTGGVMPPIYTSSTFAHSVPGEHKGYFYGRMENPTRQVFERAMADLEGGTKGYAFGSGMAAVTAILDLLSEGAHVIASDDIYGGTYVLFEQVRKKTTGLEVSYVDMADMAAMKAALRPETKMIWVETPTNPLLKMADLDVIAAFARENGLISVVDNTFASPWGQNPLAHGIDIVMHSATKYIGGHSDLIGGVAVVGENAELRDRLKVIQNATGGILGPFECYLALRGLKTLDVRMARHCESTLKIAQWLQKHPKMEKVCYPGLPDHPQHALAKKQMRGGFGGMITATVKGDIEASRRMLSACKVFTLAVSLGGVESLIQHPAIMTHAGIPKEQREKVGITDGLIRLSIGLEDADDLIADLEDALKAV